MQCSSNNVRAGCISDSGVNQNCRHALNPIAQINTKVVEAYVFPGRFAKSAIRPLIIAMLVICTATAIAQTTPRQTEVNSVPAGGSTGNDLRTQTQSAVLPSALSNYDVLIGSGDLLEIKVFGAPDYLQEVRVSDKGQITLPFIGAMRVAGLSISEAERLVSKSLADGGFFNDPQVSIFQKEYSTQGIAVLGEVQKPGIYPLLGHRTLFEAISAAGGTSLKAGKTAVVTHRDHLHQPETVVLSYDAKNSPQSNISVLPGDTIVVSKAGVVYVVGEVADPTGIVMENSDLTVLEAIALAKGTKSTAALDKAKLIRKTPNGQEEIPFSLKKLLSAKSSDFKLQPDDIVFVPSSSAKSAGKRSLEAIIQVATGVAVYARY
jgi:polysaccharide biosynthesis/export protein